MMKARTRTDRKGDDAQPAPFEVEAAAVLGRMRSAVAQLLAALPGHVAKGADLRRVLGLDNKLCWSLIKVATAANPLAAGIHVPSPAGMKRLLDAADGQNVATERRAAVAQAFADFEELVRSHASDRGTFDSMVSVYGDAPNVISLAHRRAAFRANSHIWGVQAKTQLKCAIIRPADDPAKLDAATLNAFLHLCQLRPDAPLIISRVRNTDDEGNVLQDFVREPLDPGAPSEHGVALIRQFCSKPLPKFRAVEAAAGFVYGELEAVGVGNMGAITCTEGNVAYSVVPRYRDEHNWATQLCVGVHVPSEVLVVDVLVHQETYEPGVVNPQIAVYGEHSGGPPYPAHSRERDLLPTRDSVVYLGKGPSVLHTPDVPRYAETAQYVFDRLKWNGEEFDVYRCRMVYPIVPTTVVMRFSLPDAPRTARRGKKKAKRRRRTASE